jgi:hypothetical protein
MRHEIHTYDGGLDRLLPGRWLAQTNWLGPDYSAYGATEGEAIENLRCIMRERDPNAPWFRGVPIVRCR